MAGMWALRAEPDTSLVCMRLMLFAVAVHDVAEALFDSRWRFLVEGSRLYNQLHGSEWLPPYLYTAWLPQISTVESGAILYGVMLVAACGVLLGYCYHASAVVLAGVMSYFFLMDQSQYLNHQYLLLLVAWSMAALPAAKSRSVDAWLNGRKPMTPAAVPRWTRAYLQLLLCTVYMYAALHKVNRDWLMASPLHVWTRNPRRADVLYRLWPAAADYVMDNVVRTWWLPYVMSYGGIVWDAAAPLLLVLADSYGRRTCAVLAICGSLVFHCTNYYFFNIGVFPWISMWMTVCFFPGVLFWYNQQKVARPKRRFVVGIRECLFVLAAAFIVLSPMRAALYEGHEHYVEDGHVYTWRMMSRQRDGRARIEVDTGEFGVVKDVNPARTHMCQFQRSDMRKRGGIIGQDPPCSTLLPEIDCRTENVTTADGKGALLCSKAESQTPCAERIITGGAPLMSRDLWKRIRSKPNMLARFVAFLKKHVDTVLCPLYHDRVCDSTVRVALRSSVNYRREQLAVPYSVNLADPDLPYRATASWMKPELAMEGFHRLWYPWVFLSPTMPDTPCSPSRGTLWDARTRAICAHWWYLRGGREWWYGSEMTLLSECSVPVAGHDAPTRGWWWEWLATDFNDAEATSDVVLADYWTRRAEMEADDSTKEHLDVDLLQQMGLLPRVDDNGGPQ